MITMSGVRVLRQIQNLSKSILEKKSEKSGRLEKETLHETKVSTIFLSSKEVFF